MFLPLRLVQGEEGQKTNLNKKVQIKTNVKTHNIIKSFWKKNSVEKTFA